MAAIKRDSNSALAALTGAALSLPGLQIQAGIPVAQPQANVQYGHYQESDNRMQVDVYHSDFVIPFADRMEFSFSIDRDTYSGATPVYSTSTGTSFDVVSAASQASTPFDMTAQYLLACNPANPGCQTSPESTYYFNVKQEATTAFVTQKIAEFGGVPAYVTWIANPANQLIQSRAIDTLTINTLLGRQSSQTSNAKQAFAFQPIETRTMPVFKTNFYLNDLTLSLSGGMSNEPDFDSRFGGANLSWELNDKTTTLSAGYSLTGNNIFRSAGATDDGSHNHGATATDFAKQSAFNSFNLGLSQILSKNTLLSLGSAYTHQAGYLTNPYKLVNIRGEITGAEYSDAANNRINTINANGAQDWSYATNLEVVGIDLFREVRPERRNIWTFSSQLNQYIPKFDASLHFDYRFYTDDWAINSHTFELKWYQPISHGITVTPNIRYYTQTRADFFAPFFPAPREDGFYSSDFRLADFGALSGGVTISKQFAKGIKLEAGVEYYTRQSGLQLDSGEDSSYADYNFYMVHGGLNVNLSALGTQNDHHHMHHHHGAPLPAGVMFGHMMPNEGDIMVGYRYQYSNLSGDMFHGSHDLPDSQLLNSACGSTSCYSRPDEMRMSMHMLDLMYAPTDWLNLMLMPQIMDMKMYLTPIPGATGEDEHGAGHSSGGLGDTIMMSMIKLFDWQGHHMHLGLGVSAPTGSVEVTMDGRDEANSYLQDYGMQLGSGTWDFRPNLTYTGQWNDWSWGAQLSGIKRMQERNKSGYALGDAFQSTVWGSYSLFKWLSAAVRGMYTEQGKINGQFNRLSSTSTPVDYPGNYGGKFWDAGFGLNVSLPDGEYAGHNFSVEWLQPLADKYNGYQLEREGSLFATWTYAF